MTILSIPPLIMSAIAFYIGIYHFLTYLTNKELRVNLTFSMMCFAIGSYNVCCVGNYNSLTSLQGYEWQRMQLVTIALVALGLLWFITDYTNTKNRIFAWLFTIFFGGCALVEFFDRSSLTWIVSAPLEKTFVFFGHNITYHEVSQGIFSDIEAFGLLCFFTYLFWLSFYFFWKKDTKKGLPLLLAVTLFYLTMFEDVMVSAGFYDFVYTLEYGYVGFVLIMAYAQIYHNINTQKELLESEEKFRGLVESSCDWIWEVNAEGAYTYASPQVETILGYKPEEVIGKSPFDLMPPEEKDRIAEAFKGLAETGEPIVTLENINLHKDGRRIVLETSGVAVLNAAGKATGYRGVDRDITDRKRAEEELLRYACIVSNSSDMMAILDTSCIYLATNEAYLAALGMTKEEVAGHTVTEVFGEEFFETIMKPNVEHCLQGNKICYENWFQFPVHGSRFMSINYSPFLGPDGDIRGFIVIARDITDHKHAEEELKTAKEFSENLVETANTLVVTLNSEAEITTFNRYAEKLTGYTKTEVIGRNWFDLFILQRDKENMPKVFKEALDHIPGVSQYENPIVTKSGEERLMNWSNNVLRDNCGNINGILSIGMDITDQRRAEDEREELLRVLEAKNKELQSVVYIASHDLKSPLVNIQGFSSILDDSCKQVIKEISELELDDKAMERILSLISEDIPESLRFISAGASKMKELLDGLLHVSHMGTVDINIRHLNVNDIVDNVRRVMEFQIQDADVEVVIDDLPGCLGDAEMIDQLFSNLIGNALKYLDPDRKGKIHISGTVEETQSIYCVEDWGIGIDKAHQSKIFELFHRLNPGDSVGGEGLGLTIVTRILDRLNGHIRVESEPGTGSRFFVSLPTG